MSDAEYFMAGAIVIVLVIAGANLCLLVGIRGYFNGINKRLDTIGSKYGRLMDFLEETDQLKKRKRRD